MPVSAERAAEYMRSYRLRRKAAGRPLRERSREEIIRHDWWKKYRLRPQTVQAMYDGQGGACAACRDAIAFPGTDRNTHIDHDHATGKVRGLLCNHCNLSIGHAKDSPERLVAMAAYLQR